MRKRNRLPNTVYSIWDNKTDEVVIVDASAPACARYLGISLHTFYTVVSHVRAGTDKRYTIDTRRITKKDVDEVLIE